MSNEVEFYTNLQSRGAIVKWMLEEVGCEYETHALDYATSMKSETYLAINPMGKVPAIKHKHHIVTECAAICVYLADAFPESGLAPRLDQRAEYYRWMFFAAGPLEAAITNKNLGVEVPKAKQGFVGYGTFDLTIKTIASAISKSPYIAGKEFTAADVYVGSSIGWGMQFGILPSLPEFKDYWSRISSRPAHGLANSKSTPT
jgi:glutathione S-transferase